jgi:ribosomal protein S18 acetylase RimI-like enzyme
VPHITDPSLIRSILEKDRPWAAYALADLEPPHAVYATWFANEEFSAVALVYRAFATPVLLTVGEDRHLSGVLDEVDAVLGNAQEVFLAVRPDVLRLLQNRYEVRDICRMHRMLLDPRKFQAAPVAEACRLGPADLPLLEQLYVDGEPVGESPPFFVPEMLERGAYFGAREGEALIAAAGTHVVTASVSVGAVGNIYTRRDRRGQGLATRLTIAVTAELLAMNLQTVVLNVRQDNLAAIRVYERVGYRPYCEFCEAVAAR